MADLKPETPRLAVERRLSETRSVAGVATLPLRMIFTPRRAFQRECRLKRILVDTPWRVLLWCLIWFGALVLVSIGVRYGLDQLRGMKLVIGSYWHPHSATRFGSVVLTPLHLVIAWFECAVVAFVGMAVSFRWIDLKQFLRLTIWLLPFTLAGAVFSVLYTAAHDHFLSGILMRLAANTGWIVACDARNWAMDLTVRSFDLGFGLFAGIAVATVFKRNWWLIPPVTTVLLVIAFPVFHRTQMAFTGTLYYPIVEAIYGPLPQHAGPPPLLLGPTFTVGKTAPELAGKWRVEYESEKTEPAVELTIDATGKLVFFEQHSIQSGKVARFIGDGLDHEVESDATKDDATHATYHMLSGCERTDSHVFINVRIEFAIERRRGKGTGLISLVCEEKFVGLFNDDESAATGSSQLRQESPLVNFDPGGLERPFVMRRLSASSQSVSGTSDGLEPGRRF